jgi:mRNA degradation ribonuclease J1/J2
MSNIGFFSGGKSMASIAKQKKLTIMVRQTESMKSFLSSKLKSLEGSEMIYSIWKGYERTVKTRGFIEHCQALGMNQLRTDSYLHTSGHIYRDALEETIGWIRPKALIPIHTENADAFKGLHDNLIIEEVSNGEEWQVP